VSKLTKGPKKFFEWLQNKKAGDILTEAEILIAAKWTPVSFYTYRKKNKISPFLADLPEVNTKCSTTETSSPRLIFKRYSRR